MSTSVNLALFFLHFQLWIAAIFKLVELEKSYTPFRKPKAMPTERKTKNRCNFALKGGMLILRKVVLFWFQGCDSSHCDTTPNFNLIIKTLCKGFEMNNHLFLNFNEKVVKIINMFS